MKTRLVIFDGLFTAACMAVGSWIVFSATSVFGAGVSSDSMVYLSSADSIVKGLGVFDFKGDPMTSFPPLYPLVLALLSGLSGVTPFVCGRLVNVAVTAAIILSTAILLKRCFPNRRLWFTLGTLSALVLYPLYPLAANICTDLLYILISIWFCLAAQSFLQTRRLGWLAAMTLLAMAAALLRWVGLALAASEIILIWAAYWKTKPRAFFLSLLFGGLAGLPAGLWAVVRNQWIYGHIGRGSGYISVVRNLQLTFLRLSEWVSPNPAITCLPLIPGILLLILALNRKQDWIAWLRRLFSPAVFPVLLLSWVYLTAISLTSYTLDHLQAFDHRYQVPLFFAILVFLFLILDELVLKHTKKPVRMVAELVVIGVFGTWGFYQAALLDHFIQTARKQGVAEYNDYNTKKRVRSGLVVQLIKNPPESGIMLYSNEPEMVYFFLRRPVKLSPFDPDHYTADLRALLPRYSSGWPPEEQAYLIWFKPNIKRQYYAPEVAAELVEMEKVYKSWDGEMYHIWPKR